MKLPEWLSRQRPWVPALAGGALLGLLAGVLAPVPGATAEDAAGAAWSLPEAAVLDRSDEQWFARLRPGRFWGGSGSVNARGAEKRVQWRLTGIIADPVPTAMVVSGRDPTRSLRVGDELPDGSRIVGISPDAVEFQRGDCVQSRALYAPAGAAGKDECASTP